MTEIGPELFPARKALTPGPWLPHFGHREFIERNLRIHPCAGIAIPVPDAARIGRRIDQQHVEPGVTQLVEQVDPAERSEEHTSELQSLMRISYAVFCLKKKNISYNTSTK